MVTDPGLLQAMEIARDRFRRSRTHHTTSTSRAADDSSSDDQAEVDADVPNDSDVADNNVPTDTPLEAKQFRVGRRYVWRYKVVRRRTDGVTHPVWKEEQYLGTDVDKKLLQQLRTRAAASSNSTMALFDSDMEHAVIRVMHSNRMLVVADSSDEESSEPSYCVDFET